jgi:hypothetical protein
MCPRLARFQRLRFVSELHPRFLLEDGKIHARRQERWIFQNQVLQELQKKNRVYRETVNFTLKEAIQEVISTSIPLFLTQATLTTLHPQLL